MKAVQAASFRRAIELDRLTPERAVAGATMGLAGLGVALGCASLAARSFDSLPVPLLALMGLGLAAMAVLSRRATGNLDRTLVVLALASIVSAGILAAIPEYTYGHEINGVIHRSLFSAILLFAVATPAMSQAMYYFLGATPTAHDVSRYPLIVLPIALAFSAYGLLSVRLFEDGLGQLDVDVITRPYRNELDGTAFVVEAGMLNHILGTFMLIGLTWVIAVPIGVGTGYYLSAYDGIIARGIELCTTLLRAISVFVLGVAAFSLVQLAQDGSAGGFLSDLIRGSYKDQNGLTIPTDGSFLLAASFLSLLVIPVIARAAEEGFRSLPAEIREGSVALGATEGHGLLRILLPWAMPNIVTGAILAAAEAAGAVAVIFLISGEGDRSVSPLGESTSLAFYIFSSEFGSDTFQQTNEPYQFAAAILLLAITLTLSAIALILKARIAKRRGGLTG